MSQGWKLSPANTPLPDKHTSSAPCGHLATLLDYTLVTFLHANDHQLHPLIIRGEYRSNPVRFLKFLSSDLHVSALALCCPSPGLLLTAPSPSPLPGIPCLAPSQGLCTSSYHSSLLNQHLLPLHRSIPQHRGKPTVFHHPILQLLAHYRLRFKAKLVQILLRYSLLSPLPWSFCPSHSPVTGLVMAIINIHTS